MRFNMHWTLGPDRVMSAAEMDENVAFCIACGVEVKDTPQQTRQGRCPQCDRSAVYSSELVLLMGMMV